VALKKLIASAAAFDKFIQGKDLYHMRGDETINLITDLPEALQALEKPGTYLKLDNPARQLFDDVSRLNGFVDNLSGSFEVVSTMAAAANEHLLAEYGALAPLNGGRSVVFVDNKGQHFVECDGLIKNSTKVLLNEAKLRLHPNDIEKLKGSTQKLQLVIANPSEYTSQPAGYVEQLAGLTVVPLASGVSYLPEVQAACAAANIHLLRRNGEGFDCTIHK
jgi:hypothetical protein